MKTLTLLVVALVTACGFVGCTKAQPPIAKEGTGVESSPQGDAAVRATFATFVKTWNDHDMKSMSELITEDAVWILRNGNVWRGKEQVYRSYDHIHRDIAADISSAKSAHHPLSPEKMEVRFLAPQLAVATARNKWGQGDLELHTRDSFVMANKDGAWRIVYFQSTTMIPEVVNGDRADFGLENSATATQIKAQTEQSLAAIMSQ